MEGALEINVGGKILNFDVVNMVWFG